MAASESWTKKMTISVKPHPASRALPYVEGKVLAGTLTARGTELEVVSEFPCVLTVGNKT